MEKELIFFEVLSSLLKYNRLKLLHEKSVYEESSSTLAVGVESEESGWIPSLQNVINAFDTMSFRRVFDSFEKLRNPITKRYSDIVSPLGLYKEMICYLRILLESSDETHNEFAIARLYNLFYTTNEKRDPLNRLLLDWSPGTIFSFPSTRPNFIFFLLTFSSSNSATSSFSSSHFYSCSINSPFFSTSLSPSTLLFFFI